MTDDNKLAEIEELCEAATQGPWRAKETFNGYAVYRDFDGYPPAPIAIARAIRPECVIGLDEDDARFIASVRTAVPMLLAALKAEREKTARLREALEDAAELLVDAGKSGHVVAAARAALKDTQP